MGGESGHKTGADGWMGLGRLEPLGKLGNSCLEGCSHAGVLAGDHMTGGFRAVSTAGT